MNTSQRVVVSRPVTSSVALPRGVGVVRGSAVGRVDLAAPGVTAILGVTMDETGPDEPNRIGEPGSIVACLRDPAFTDPVAAGDGLAVGDGGAFAAATNGDLVVAVEEPDDGTGLIMGQPLPIAAAVAGGPQALGLARHTVTAAEATADSVEIDISFTPDFFSTQLYRPVGGGVWDYEPNWSRSVEIIAGPKARVNSSPPNVAEEDDVIMFSYAIPAA